MTVYAMESTWVEDAEPEDWSGHWPAAQEAEDALQWLSNIGQGAASGAATGAVAGPWGALIGGLVGGGPGAAQTAMAQQQPKPAPRPGTPPPAHRPPVPAPAPGLAPQPGPTVTTRPRVTQTIAPRVAPPAPAAAGSPSASDVAGLVTVLAPLLVTATQRLQPELTTGVFVTSAAGKDAPDETSRPEDFDIDVAETDCWPAETEVADSSRVKLPRAVPRAC